MSGFILLAAWCTAAFAQPDNGAVPGLRSHPELGTVLVNDEDAGAYEKFVAQDLGRVVAVARALRLERLPVDRAHFTLTALNPHYSYDDRFVLLGDIVRRGEVGIGYRAVSIHELGHAMLFGYMNVKNGGARQYQRHEWQLLLPMHELFADTLAVFLIGDPEAVTSSLSGSPPRDAQAEAQRREELARRGVSGGIRWCDGVDPGAHHWFTETRRMLWEDVYVGKFKRSPKAVAGIIEVLADEIIVEWNKQVALQALRERAQFERLSQPAPRTVLFMPAPTVPREPVGSQLLNTPQAFEGQVDEITDDRLRNVLRARFGLPPL